MRHASGGGRFVCLDGRWIDPNIVTAVLPIKCHDARGIERERARVVLHNAQDESITVDLYADEVVKLLDPPFEPEKALTFAAIPQPPDGCGWNAVSCWLTDLIHQMTWDVDEPNRAKGIAWMRELKSRVKKMIPKEEALPQ